jgi:aromatic ring hydroxylase
MLMIAADYRESLRAYKPRVFVNGQRVESVADEPLPGINAVSVTCDFAHRAEHVAITTARQGTSGKTVSRMLHINENSTDLLYKLEDLTVSNQGAWYSVISLHGGDSPEAMKREIWRNYPCDGEGRVGREPARSRHPCRLPTRLQAARPLLPHGLRGAEAVGGNSRGGFKC